MAENREDGQVCRAPATFRMNVSHLRIDEAAAVGIAAINHEIPDRWRRLQIWKLLN
jgi:hypothetical protein